LQRISLRCRLSRSSTTFNCWTSRKSAREKWGQSSLHKSSDQEKKLERHFGEPLLRAAAKQQRSEQISRQSGWRKRDESNFECLKERSREVVVRRGKKVSRTVVKLVRQRKGPKEGEILNF